jgi:hypothetical protein
MKVSTLTVMALLSASCVAAPNHTARLDSLAVRAALATARANAAPVAPPAPGIAAESDIRPERWHRIKLPKPTGLAHRFAHERRSQT